MIETQYSLIQYIGDLARNEPLNVGILIWHGDEYRLKIDTAAADRVVRETPCLANDALSALESILVGEVNDFISSGNKTFEDYVASRRGYPVKFSEPRFTTILVDMEETLDRLIQLIVRPRWVPS